MVKVEKDLILAIDHGTSGVKTALVGRRGEIVAETMVEAGIVYLPGGGVEQDPDEWWEGLITASRRLFSMVPGTSERIAGIGCSSQMSTTVVCDRDGRHLIPALTWLDSRGAPHVRRAMAGWPSVKGYDLRKMLRWVSRTGGGPTLSGKDDIAHMLYVQKELPDIYRRANWFLSSKDWFNLRLTGRVAASVDSAALFWVVDSRDLSRPVYDAGLIAELGIDAGKLPPLRRADEVLGPVTDDVADVLGLPRGTPVSVGSSDLPAACVGSGAVRDFEGHVYLGTSSWLLCHVPFKKTDVWHAMATLPSSIPGRYFAANEQDMAGGCLDWLIRNMGIFGDGPMPDDPHRRLDALAEGADPASGGLVFTPWLNGEKTPVDSETLRAGFHNLDIGTTRGQIVRSVLEGVACNSRWVLELVEKFVGRRMDPLAIIGGGARSDLWCQIYADVLDRRIVRVAQPRQANARGAAFITWVALEKLEFSAIPDVIVHDREFTPNPANRKAYDGLYRSFREIYRRTAGFYDRVNG